MQIPPPAYLADVYRYLPFLVVHVTTDGTVLHCNPEALKVTGYSEFELVGRNFWATVFPGKLFAQVPRFISLLNPMPASGLLKDVPMTLRTKEGAERVIAWTRYIHVAQGCGNGEDSSLKSFICIGVDLTDRLQDADRSRMPEALADGDTPGLMAFGPHVGNAGAIEGEIVTPLAITPKLPDRTGVPCAIEQVREAMARVETHFNCVQGAFLDSEIKAIEALRATGNLGGVFELFSRRDLTETGRAEDSLGTIRVKVADLLKLYRPEIG
ncbi:MAG TPA: PAS domain-containing protein [Phycisphaerae bacterium]|nr:PAS domain-containing protein [Phycisphaerae bacterium]